MGIKKSVILHLYLAPQKIGLKNWTLFTDFFSFLETKNSFPHWKKRKLRKTPFLLWSKNSFANSNSVVGN
jgi:hypothetical protein